MALDISKLTPAQVRCALEAGVLLIDLRPYEQFALSHIPRSISLAFSRRSLAQRIATAIPAGLPLILLADKGGVAEAAGDALVGVDRNPLRGIITTGTDTWRDEGLPLATLPGMPTDALLQRLHAPNNQLVLIDVREPFEWELGYVNGSLLIPLGEIWQRARSLDPRKEIILICQEGLRSSTAASILLHQNFSSIANVPGGIGNWLDANYPTIRPPKPQKN